MLRSHLAQLGVTAIPKGLVIRYEDWTPPSVEVRHNPDSTETCSVHDKVVGFDGSAETIARFLDVATAHALRMERRDARRIALLQAGHDPRRPPMHAVEAHPLLLLAHRLVRAGAAGMDGNLMVENGLLVAKPLTLTIAGTAIRMTTTFEGLRVDLPGTMPDSVVTALNGRRLADVVELPGVDDAPLDEAVRALVVNEASASGTTMTLRLRPADAVAMEDTPPSEDGMWKTLRPMPQT